MAQHAETQPVLIDVVAGELLAAMLVVLEEGKRRITQPFSFVESTPASGYPLGGQTRLTIRNEHLQYIITWLAFDCMGR